MERRRPGLTEYSAATALGCSALGLALRTPVPVALWALLALTALLASGGRPSLASALTWARLCLLGGAVLVWWREPPSLVGPALLAWVLDGVDGALARWSGRASDFGARLDLEADAALVLLLAQVLATGEAFGAWVLVAGWLRHAYVLSRFASTAPAVERRSGLGRSLFSLAYLGLVAGLVPAWRPLAQLLVPLGVGGLLFSFAPDFLALARVRR